MPITPQSPIIEWKMPNSTNVWIDWTRSCILVKVTLTRVGGTYIRASNLINTMIERFELTEGNEQVEDYQFHPERIGFHYTLDKEEESIDTSGRAFYGDASQAIRNANGATADFEYKIPIQSVLSNIAMFPTFPPYHSINNHLQFRWYIAQPSRWIETDAGTYTYSITQWDIHYEQVTVMNIAQFSGLWNNSKMGAAGAPKISWLYEHVEIRPLDTSTSQTVLIEQKRSSIHGILCTVRRSADVNDPTVDDKFETWYGPNSGTVNFPITSYQWNFNDGFWPEREISVAGANLIQAYRWLQLWMNHDDGNGNLKETFTITPGQFGTDKFVIVGDFRNWPGLNDTYNAVSTISANMNIQLRLTFSAPPDSGLQLVVHTFYDRDWYYGLDSGSKVRW